MLVAGAVAALAAGLSVLLVAEPAAASTPLDPPAPTQALYTGSLPQCSATNLASGRSHAATDLGWGPGTPRVLISYTESSGSVSQYEYAPQIPCQSSGVLYVPLMIHVFSLAGNNSHAIGNQTSTWTCWDGSNYTATVVSGVSISGANGTSVNGTDYTVSSGAAAVGTRTLSNCVYLVSIVYTINSGYTTDHKTTLTATWKPGQWKTADSGWAAATDPSQFVGGGAELPIQCPIDTSGSDIVTVFGHFFGSLASLPVCLLVPVGWDRSGQIAAVWNSGPAGQLVTAFKESVPSGLVCGPIATIPWMGTSIALDTCTADVASSTVKTVIGWVMVLGVAALVVRRLFWVVGSQA